MKILNYKNWILENHDPINTSFNSRVEEKYKTFNDDFIYDLKLAIKNLKKMSDGIQIHKIHSSLIKLKINFIEKTSIIEEAKGIIELRLTNLYLYMNGKIIKNAYPIDAPTKIIWQDNLEIVDFYDENWSIIDIMNQLETDIDNLGTNNNDTTIQKSLNPEDNEINKSLSYKKSVLDY